MLHARGQSTAELQQQHVDRLHRHTIHTTSAGMAHANGPMARATVNSTSWWWGQEQRVVLNFGDADTTQKATGATSAQIDFVCVICTSNSWPVIVLLLLLPLFLSLSLCVCLCSRVPHNDIAIYLPALLFFRSYNEVFKQTTFIPYYLSTNIDFVFVLCTLSFSPSLSLCVFVQGYLTQQYRHFCTYPFIFSQLQRSVCTNGIYCLLPFWQVLFFDL